MKIVSWNFRYLWNGDGKNSAIHRVGYAYDKVQKEKPEIIAFQEIIPLSLELLKKMLPEYEFFGSMRTADFNQEGLYIAWRKDSFALTGSEVFWLSPTPYIAGSRFSNQSDSSRVCVMVKLRDLKTNKCYRLWDVHLDDKSDQARQEGLKCLFDFVKVYSTKDETPHIILGDFNATPDSETIAWCDNQKGFVDVSKGFKTTFHDYGKCDDNKIDYIYVSESIRKNAVKTELWTDEHDGIFLSDHYPVVLTLKQDDMTKEH